MRDATKVLAKGRLLSFRAFVQHRDGVEHVGRQHVGELVRVLSLGIDQERR